MQDKCGVTVGDVPAGREALLQYCGPVSPERVSANNLDEELGKVGKHPPKFALLSLPSVLPFIFIVAKLLHSLVPACRPKVSISARSDPRKMVLVLLLPSVAYKD